MSVKCHQPEGEEGKEYMEAPFRIDQEVQRTSVQEERKDHRFQGKLRFREPWDEYLIESHDDSPLLNSERVSLPTIL
jgi:hypothetical protein